MDLLTGGDLRYHIGKRKKFTEKETSRNFEKKIFFAEFYPLIKNFLSHVFL